jgi:hypothetical protein
MTTTSQPVRQNLLAFMAAFLIGGLALSFSTPGINTGDDGDSNLLERMTIDATEADLVTLYLDWKDMEEDAFLFQFSTLSGDVLTSGRWVILPGPNTMQVESDGWPVGHLVLSVLTKKSLARKVFKRFPPAAALQSAPSDGTEGDDIPAQPTEGQTPEVGDADLPKKQGAELAPN